MRRSQLRTALPRGRELLRVSFSESDTEITWSAVEQTATAFSFYFALCSPVLANMNHSRCVVTFTDFDRIVHEVEVWASTVYEAVGEAMREFRAGGITRDLPGLNTELPIAVHRQPVTHKLQLRQVTQLASGGGKSPRDLIERKRIQHLLGTDTKA